MEQFKFEEVYENLARPMDNRPVPTDPFGPIMVKILLEEDGIFILGTLQPSAMRAYFTDSDGAEHLAFLVEQMLSKQGESFCIVKVYECYQDVTKQAKGIALAIHHKTGVRMGYIPIDAERVSHYAPMLDENIEFIPVQIKPESLH